MSIQFNLSMMIAAACIAAPAAADITIETYAGEATISAQPKTLAVLDIAAVDTLDALGVEIAAIPQPHSVEYLDDVAAKAVKVGSLFEPDFEGLANLNADLIIAGGRSSRQVEALSKVSPTIDMTIWGDENATLFEQALSRLEAYGTLVGKSDEAEVLKQNLLAKAAQAKAAAEGKGNALIVMTNGPKVSAYGAGSRFSWFHEVLDIPEAVDGVDDQTHGEAISFEFIADANPDWLIVIDRAAAIGQEGDAAAVTLDNPLVAGTNAWKNDRVIYLNSANVYIAAGGYQSMMQILETFSAEFNGGA
jgi:iron complex transport system substrate-binding protein